MADLTPQLDDKNSPAERWKYYCAPKTPDPVKHVYVTTVAEKQRREAKQLELYEAAHEKVSMMTMVKRYRKV